MGCGSSKEGGNSNIEPKVVIKDEAVVAQDVHALQVPPMPTDTLDLSNPLRIRKSLRQLEEKENAEELENLLRAMRDIQSKTDLNDPNSYWVIAGYHGAPYAPYEGPMSRVRRQGYWGGYCQHANVLFPSWHRFYLLQLENALNTTAGRNDIALPYWDTTSAETMKEGLPDILTQEEVTIDGEKVPNPFKYFRIPDDIDDDEANRYSTKPAGYTPVRFPFSGRQNSYAKKYNERKKKRYPDPVRALNTYLLQRLNNYGRNSTAKKYRRCLKTRGFNAFSNKDSSKSIKGYYGGTSLETPHDRLHVAIGGRYGDMGSTDTAALDPLFFFHHCNIDRIFWVWQKKHGCTDKFEIDPNDMRGAMAGIGSDKLSPTQKPNEKLTVDTWLAPFKAPGGEKAKTSDSYNIERQLGYTYSIGSLDSFDFAGRVTEIHAAPGEEESSKPCHYMLKVDDINRNNYIGSFLIKAYCKKEDGREEIGEETVFNRMNRKICQNCKDHDYASAVFDLKDIEFTQPPKPEDFIIEVEHSDPETCITSVEELSLLYIVEAAGGNEAEKADTQPSLTIYEESDSDSDE